jgi:hypothetical protein
MGDIGREHREVEFEPLTDDPLNEPAPEPATRPATVPATGPSKSTATGSAPDPTTPSRMP